MTPEILDKINKFTRRPFTEDEVYVFSVILCDNDIDRDCERFSDEALETICRSFIGRTGISDHQPSAANQTARIFDTELITDPERLTAYGAPYKYVKASAYMVRTDDNRNLIAEIDGGIKKEVSISCSAAKKLCSVCGCDKSVSSCDHVKGRKYSGKLCHTILDGITDTYEWSFVAVPAQVNAGVTKHFSSEAVTAAAVYPALEEADNELRRDIRRLAYFVGGRTASDAAALTSASMNTGQLVSFKRSLENQRTRSEPMVQLRPDDDEKDGSEQFAMR